MGEIIQLEDGRLVELITLRGGLEIRGQQMRTGQTFRVPRIQADQIVRNGGADYFDTKPDNTKGN
jgi:hypothetical protein